MANLDNSDFQELLDADARELGVGPSGPTSPSKPTVRAALLRVVRSIQRAVVKPAPSKVELVQQDEGDALAVAASDAVEDLLGASSGKTFRAPVGARFPIFGAAHQKFRAAMPQPWTLRVDDLDTYAAWRDLRREPYVEALADRVTALEEALALHVQDNHAGRLAVLERAFDQHVAEHDVVALGEEVDRARVLVECGGDLVPLSVEPSLERGVECWQDGDEVLCTLYYRGADGVERVLTAGIPYRECLDGAVGHVAEAGVDPLEIAPVFTRTAQSYGASVVLPRIAAVAPEAVALAVGEVPFMCRVTTPGDPALAAAMSLTQQARKDKAARLEVRSLRAEGAGDLLDRADRQLTAAKLGRAG